MATWQAFAEQEPELAARVRDRFAARKHCTIATLRSDGSPRISGTEVEFADGEVRIGSMANAVKARDLLRDPRLSLHSPTVDPPEAEPTAWEGEAKISGTAVPVPSEDASHRFAIDITEAVVTHLDAEGPQLVITSWHPDRGVSEARRD